MKDDPAERSPAGPTPKASSECPKQRDEDLRPLSGSETVLVVEDEPALRELMRRQLTKRGYTVLHAGNSAEAFALWHEHRDDVRLLLTDLRIGDGTTGCQLAEKILSIRRDLKVIYCSGYDRETVEADYELPRDAIFLPKPFFPKELAQIVRTTLDREKKDEG